MSSGASFDFCRLCWRKVISLCEVEDKGTEKGLSGILQ